MDIKAAQDQVAKWGMEHSNELALKGTEIEASYIWNPGGFVNQSYRITDGETVRHVKFAQEQKVPHLKQWSLIDEYLRDKYLAPLLVYEVNQEVLPKFPYGLVFEFIEGKPLSSVADPIPVVSKVLRTLSQLHQDKEIQKVIASDKTQSYAEAFIEEYVHRFEEDLIIIESEKHLLDFVSDETLEWFHTEVISLRQLANNKTCFEKPAMDVVHNDLNWQNILVKDSDEFWIIDWDDLKVNGDAAMDYSVLLYPLYHTEAWPMLRDQVIALAGEEVYERMDLYFRAKLLDDVIDILADYVESENVPAVREMTQKRAKEIHLHAYSEYKRLYVR